MVFRKPFAFIIKHFKAFHVVMCLTSLFIMYSTNQVRSMVKNLISSNVFTYPNADIYAKSPIFLISIIGLTAVGFVYWLFKARKKDLKYYSLVIAYYVGTILGHIYLFDQLTTLSKVDLTMDELGLIRDISTIILVASIPIFVISLIRSIGFNIKQFNFSKDIKELEITDKDSEEFEVLIGQNNYKYIRKIRKTIRELKYSILENIFYITVVSVFLIFVGAIFLGYNMYKNSHTIAKSEITTVNGVYYAINDTYITSKDQNGNVLKSNYKYVIVNLSMKNMTKKTKTFDNSIFTLRTGRLIYRPIGFFQSEFNDLGLFLENGREIPMDSFLTGIVIFEIPASMNVQNFNLFVFRDFEDSEEEFLVNYEKFAAYGYLLDEETKKENVELNNTFTKDIYKKNRVSFAINKAYITDAYSEKYVICKTEKECDTRTQLIKPDNLTNNTMIVIEYDGALDSEANYYKSIRNMDDFFNNFASVEYMVGLETYKSKGTILYKDINGKVFMSVDRKILKASNIDIVFNFRNTTVSFKIK